jgi:hypothetical protein
MLLASAAGAVDVGVNPRVEYIQGRERKPLSTKLLLKADAAQTAGLFSFRAEGFGEFDGMEAARDRHTRLAAHLQEAWVQAQPGDFIIRAGRQPVRWSESWTLPSLDVWTGRRWNRMFTDPLAEQLKHPTGLLASHVGPQHELNAFLELRPARDEFPDPLPNPAETWRAAGGGRLKIRAGGFDVAGVYAYKDRVNVYGASLSSAFEYFVPRLEFGARGETDIIYTPGLDVFVEDWSFSGQTTWHWLQTPNPSGRWDPSGYLSIRRNGTVHSLELQYQQSFKASDRFAAIAYGYAFTDFLKGTLFVQHYHGDRNLLFTVYDAMTVGWLAGVRLEATAAF